MAQRARPWRLPVLIAGCLAAAAAWSGAPAQAQQDQLQQIERILAEDRKKGEDLARRRAAIRAEIKTLRGQLQATARKAQDLEDKLTIGERRLAELERERIAKQQTFDTQHGALSKTLAALQRIARRPPEAALVAPGPPADTYRSALLLSKAVPVIEARATSLHAELTALEVIKRQISLEQSDLTAANSALQRERRDLTALIEKKRRLEDVASAEQRAARARIKQLAREASTLREFLAQLERDSERRSAAEAKSLAQAKAEMAAREKAEAEAQAQAAAQAAAQAEAAAEARALAESESAALPPAEQALEPPAAPAETQTAALPPPAVTLPLEKPVNVRPFPQSPSRSNLVMPARGDLVRIFGDPQAQAGEESKGISIKTRNKAQVVAPYDGRVAYAGEFRRYGQILIIEHGGRYHTLLAGLALILAVEGQWVLAGEPIGVMGNAEDVDPILYLELRQSGQPINPLPWLATTDNKVQG